MAKEGNRSMGPKTMAKGPCADCGETKSAFTPVRRYSETGKRTMAVLCEKCTPKV